MTNITSTMSVASNSNIVLAMGVALLATPPLEMVEQRRVVETQIVKPSASSAIFRNHQIDLAAKTLSQVTDIFQNFAQAQTRLDPDFEAAIFENLEELYES